MKPLRELLDRHPLPMPVDGGKNDKGSVCIVGGPPSCPGAVVLAASAALRMGAGRVRVAVDPSVAPHVGVTVPEVAVCAWDQKATPPPAVVAALHDAHVVLVGPGHTSMDEIVVRSVAEHSSQATIVLDAGALPVALAIARNRRVVLAPNTDEASRLLDREEQGVEDELAPALAERAGAPVAVRGAVTVIADPGSGDCWVFDDSPAGLGTPGSGDVFVGALAALLAGECTPVAALGWAVYLHAEAGRRMSAFMPVGYTASDVVGQLALVRAAAAGAASAGVAE